MLSGCLSSSFKQNPKQSKATFYPECWKNQCVRTCASPANTSSPLCGTTGCTGCWWQVQYARTQLLKTRNKPRNNLEVHSKWIPSSWLIRWIDLSTYNNTAGAIIQTPARDYPVETVSNKEQLTLTDIAVDLPPAGFQTTKQFYKTSAHRTKHRKPPPSPPHILPLTGRALKLSNQWIIREGEALPASGS